MVELDLLPTITRLGLYGDEKALALLAEMAEWCVENQIEWRQSSGYAYFEDEDAAFAFKMRWL